MSDADDILRDLDPQLDAGEAEELAAVGELLRQSRPLPRPQFRGQLSRMLALRLPLPPRPAHLWRWVAFTGGSGGGLLIVAALSAAGSGPLGP